MMRLSSALLALSLLSILLYFSGATETPPASSLSSTEAAKAPDFDWSGSYQDDTHEGATLYVCQDGDTIYGSFGRPALQGTFRAVLAPGHQDYARGVWHSHHVTLKKDRTGYLDLRWVISNGVRSLVGMKFSSMNRAALLEARWEVFLEDDSTPTPDQCCATSACEPGSVFDLLPAYPRLKSEIPPQEWTYPVTPSTHLLQVGRFSTRECEGTPERKKKHQYLCDSKQSLAQCVDGSLVWSTCKDCRNQVDCQQKVQRAPTEGSCFKTGSSYMKMSCTDEEIAPPAEGSYMDVAIKTYPWLSVPWAEQEVDADVQEVEAQGDATNQEDAGSPSPPPAEEKKDDL